MVQPVMIRMAARRAVIACGSRTAAPVTGEKPPSRESLGVARHSLTFEISDEISGRGSGQCRPALNHFVRFRCSALLLCRRQALRSLLYHSAFKRVFRCLDRSLPTPTNARGSGRRLSRLHRRGARPPKQLLLLLSGVASTSCCGAVLYWCYLPDLGLSAAAATAAAAQKERR